jgi:hypothetical protein
LTATSSGPASRRLARPPSTSAPRRSPPCGTTRRAGHLLLNGLVYDDLHDDAPRDADSRIAWLRLQPDDSFRPQPYEQLAAVYRKHGLDESARAVLIAKNEDWARLTPTTRIQRVGHWLLGALAGYGYRPWRALWYVVGVVLWGTLVFGLGHRAGLLAPTAVQASERFHPFIYALDVFLPIVNLRQEHLWWPRTEWPPEAPKLLGVSKVFWGRLLRAYAILHVALGWTLNLLLVASVGGLIRR